MVTHSALALQRQLFPGVGVREPRVRRAGLDLPDAVSVAPGTLPGAESVLDLSDDEVRRRAGIGSPEDRAADY